MASGTTEISDVIVPELFTTYVQQMTEQKSRLIRSGALVRDQFLDNFLAGAGLTIHAPSFKDLDDDDDNVSSDTGSDSSPKKIGTAQEIAVRLSRNNSWASADLVQALIAKDPMDAIASRVSDYWMRRLQAAYLATMKGVFADNDAAPTGTEHTQGDLTHDISGASYVAGVTSFSTEAFLDTCVLMGDSQDDLGMVFMHSIVYNRAQKNNLIDFIPDSTNQPAQAIPTFLGRIVIVDDGMPFSSGVFETWLFGAGATRLGVGSPKVPTETERFPAANNGGGEEVLYNRVEWSIHPAGHGFVVASPAAGGPSNAATSGNLAHASSWQRAFTERKQIKIARLKTREF